MQERLFPEITRRSTPRGGSIHILLSGVCYHDDPAFAAFGIGWYRMASGQMREISLLREEVERLARQFPTLLYAGKHAETEVRV